MNGYVFRTTRNRRIWWGGEYSTSGKSLRCHLKGGRVILVDIATGQANLGQNTRSKTPWPKPPTCVFDGDEHICPDDIAKAIRTQTNQED